MKFLVIYIVGGILFVIVDRLLGKLVFHTEFFNKTIRNHKYFQLILRLLLIVWIILMESVVYYFKNNLHQPGIAWVARGFFFGIFLRFIRYKEKVDW